MEKTTKRRLMLFQQRSATGMLSTTMPTKVGKEKPKSDVMRSMRIARPVNPLESRFAGFTNAWIV